MAPVQPTQQRLQIIANTPERYSVHIQDAVHSSGAAPDIEQSSCAKTALALI
jgi:hypothetical protein